jgi:hypothetical protein
MSSTAKSFLTKLKDLNDANTVSIKVPSLDKKVEFKLPSIKQQKDLLRTTFDGVDGIITRTAAANQIILDNAIGEKEFLIIDKPAIFIALRTAAIGSNITIKKEKYDLKKVKPIKLADIEFTKSVEHDGITVELKVPTLAVDTEVSKKLAKEFAKFDNIDDKLKQSIDTVVAFESIKYIESISVGEDIVTFKDISVHERNEIVNQLPIALNHKIVDYIGGIKEVTDKAMTVAEEVVVEIDASFLSSD